MNGVPLSCRYLPGAAEAGRTEGHGGFAFRPFPAVSFLGRLNRISFFSNILGRDHGQIAHFKIGSFLFTIEQNVW